MSLEILGMAVLIFAARVADVSLGTLRTAFIVRGKRAFAFAFGFVEVLVWVAVVAQVITNLNHPIYFVAFALGFACGTVVGITLEGWFAIGEQVVRVFTSNGAVLASTMRERGFNVTEFAGTGRTGPVSLLFVQVRRRQTNTVIEAARELDPLCFYTVDDVRQACSAVAARRHVSHEHFLQTFHDPTSQLLRATRAEVRIRVGEMFSPDANVPRPVCHELHAMSHA